MKIKAFGHNILIDYIQENITRSGLVYVEDMTDPVGLGVIRDKGEKVTEELTIGDILIFERGRQYELNHLFFVHDDFIIATIPKKVYDRITDKTKKINQTSNRETDTTRE